MGSREICCGNCGFKWVISHDVIMECPRCQFVPLEEPDEFA